MAVSINRRRISGLTGWMTAAPEDSTDFEKYGEIFQLPKTCISLAILRLSIKFTLWQDGINSCCAITIYNINFIGLIQEV